MSGDEISVRRAKELGLVSGVICTLERRAPFHGPVEISTARGRFGVRLGRELMISVEVLAEERSAPFHHTPVMHAP